MFPTTPPAASLSRSRLKALAKWVRDELDLLVAREGPNVLRPDDVLILHETFIALRLATDITALDLRATRIHVAVQDIAGVATRWPGRLCDDCDKILAIWTAKFGSLKNLHPFMYGRGGRLEGIASPNEYSREALLKRWSEQCPEKLHPKRSHRLGDLGFRPGDWWINTLFAYHAGIIGLEAVEGGTTFDKHGAYALVLKDTGEVEACHGDTFTYRVPQGDRGKYRLTAATPRSRDPIRVLRSHSINSVWGPKAGVRYEGLFAVIGWSIHQAKRGDIVGGQWKEGDILFEVRLERRDPVPFTEVTTRPSATEVDDYAEYKRLRKLHRDPKRKPGLGIDLSAINTLHPSKAAPSIPPPIFQLQPSLTSGLGATKALLKDSPRKLTFKPPHFDLSEERRRPDPNAITPALVNATDTHDYFAHLPPRNGSTLAVPIQSPSQPQPPSITSASSAHTVASNMREVAPWTDFDAHISTARHPASPFQKRPGKQTSTKESPPLSPTSERRNSPDSKPPPSKPHHDETTRRSIFARTRNPMAKLFDGAHDANELAGSRYRTSSSSDGGVRVLSPIPVRPVLRGFMYPYPDPDLDTYDGSEDSFDGDGSPRRVSMAPMARVNSGGDITSPPLYGRSAAWRFKHAMRRERGVVFRMPNWGVARKKEREGLGVVGDVGPDQKV